MQVKIIHPCEDINERPERPAEVFVEYICSPEDEQVITKFLAFLSGRYRIVGRTFRSDRGW